MFGFSWNLRCCICKFSKQKIIKFHFECTIFTALSNEQLHFHTYSTHTFTLTFSIGNGFQINQLIENRKELIEEQSTCERSETLLYIQWHRREKGRINRHVKIEFQTINFFSPRFLFVKVLNNNKYTISTIESD